MESIVRPPAAEHFSVRALIKQVLDSTASRDFTEIAQEIFDSTPRDHRDEAYLQLLRVTVQGMITDHRRDGLNPSHYGSSQAPSRGQSWDKRENPLGWLDVLLPSAEPSRGVRLREATVADLKFAEDERRRQGEANLAMAKWYGRLRRALASTKCEHLGDLPEERLHALAPGGGK